MFKDRNILIVQQPRVHERCSNDTKSRKTSSNHFSKRASRSRHLRESSKSISRNSITHTKKDMRWGSRMATEAKQFKEQKVCADCMMPIDGMTHVCDACSEEFCEPCMEEHDCGDD
jgi:hypothetical protein